LCFSIGFTSESSSACNHDPDVFPSKPVRPQIFNEPMMETGPGVGEFRGRRLRGSQAQRLTGVPGTIFEPLSL
jgi:hypothetical protein